VNNNNPQKDLSDTGTSFYHIFYYSCSLSYYFILEKYIRNMRA